MSHGDYTKSLLETCGLESGSFSAYISADYCCCVICVVSWRGYIQTGCNICFLYQIKLPVVYCDTPSLTNKACFLVNFFMSKSDIPLKRFSHCLKDVFWQMGHS